MHCPGYLPAPACKADCSWRARPVAASEDGKKCAVRRSRHPSHRVPEGKHGYDGRQRRSAESPRLLNSRAHSFTSQRFHVLLNSLFKVLFNFPSRYLFAIGLQVVFSLRWSLPPD
jgi:hypothetical protein